MGNNPICSSNPLNSIKRVIDDNKKQDTAKRTKLTTDDAPDVSSASAPCCPPHATDSKSSSNAQALIVTPKRQGYLSWDDYFLAVAILSSKRSKDPETSEGACIVDPQNRIVGMGYNGFPRGCSDDVLPWARHDTITSDKIPWLHTQDPFVCHAVTNAILNKCSDDVAGCRLYVVKFPCSDCAKMIIQSRIQEVVVLDRKENKRQDNDETQASRILLDMAGVEVRYVQPSTPFVSLDFWSALALTDPQPDPSNQEPPKEAVPIPTEARTLLMKEANYDPATAKNLKRTDSISWSDYFMAMAFLTAQRSKDPNTQVGACIVDAEQRIVGLGYNGFPRGCSDDALPWARSNQNPLHNKYLYVCHAEVNAILNKGSANVKGATIYVALFPCQNCAKMIIQAGIREVVYMSDAYRETDGCRASRIMFELAEVKLRNYIPSVPRMRLDYSVSKSTVSERQ
jgi:dCMP deaminase